MSESLETFYQHLLCITDPWKVIGIERDSTTRIVTAKVEYGGNFCCPKCGEGSKLHDHRKRNWRHLDSCNHKTIVEAKVPRVKCPDHGIQQLPVKWSEKNSRFTMEFEQLVILWLKEDSISTVSKNFGISWFQVDGIMKRAVNRGLLRKQKVEPEHIGIDETSFKKRHDYVTIVLDKSHGHVLDILDDRKSETLTDWFKSQNKANLGHLKTISMDMWDPFIKSTSEVFKNYKDLICFDRFHVSAHLNSAVNKVRSMEFKELQKKYPEKNILTKTKFQWLTNSDRIDNRSKKRRDFLKISKLNLKTSRAWRIKEAASTLWDYSYMGVAEKEWKSLLRWISLSQLKPMIKVGKMIRRYFWGILNAIRHNESNAKLESVNSKIQKIKRVACGYRNKERFKTAILFHLGGLDLSSSSTK